MLRQGAPITISGVWNFTYEDTIPGSDGNDDSGDPNPTGGMLSTGSGEGPMTPIIVGLTVLCGDSFFLDDNAKKI